MNPYSTNKALFAIDRLALLKSGAQPSPVHLQLVLSDLCNHNCNFCAYRQDGYQSSELFIVKDEKGNTIKNPNRMITTHDAIQIVRDCKELGVKAIQFTGGGEPTVHPNCSIIIDVAHSLGIETSLVTNGSKLNSAMRESLMGSSWVRISLDAGTKETYRMIRGLNSDSMWDSVLRDVNNLAVERNQNKSGLYIGISFVVTKDNWEEIPEAAKIAKEIGADSIRFASRFTNENDNYYSDYGELAEELCEAEVSKSTDEFTAINSLTERRGDLRLGNPDYDLCTYQHLTTYIGADMNLYVCFCNAYNRYGLIGSLKGKGFLKLWQSEQKIKYMREFNPRNCNRCQFNSRNRDMLAIMQSLPDTHVYFI